MPPKRKLERKYEDAFYVDVNRLIAEYEKLEEALRNKPTDPKALAAKAKLKPFLEKKSLDARLANAQKMDKANLDKIVATLGF